MQRADLAKIRLYPEFRNCAAPSTERILEIFSTVSRHQLHHDGVLVKTFHPELTAQHVQVLDLMELTPSVYTQLT
jgi:glutamine amidotransferase PdxT